MIILIGGEKGGPGKTTIATNLAAMRTRKFSRLTSNGYRQAAYGGVTGALYEKTIKLNLGSLAYKNLIRLFAQRQLALKTKYEDINIDAGGRDSPELRSGPARCRKSHFPTKTFSV